MKICFVQPETEYQISVNRHALAQTLPQIISSFRLQPEEYCVYIFGKSLDPFEYFLTKNRVTHVLITAITSTFPKAVEIALMAKKYGIITGLGGIFATMNAQKIHQYYKMFDFVLTGHATKEMLDKIQQNCFGVICGPSQIDDLYPIGDIVTSDKFSMYTKNDTICYELVNGCPFSCTYCTIKAAFNTPCLVRRDIDIAKEDLLRISKKWDKLKLIDDDISLAFRASGDWSFHNFSQVIAETRVDNINEKVVARMKDAGITHLLFGIETFDNQFLIKSNKSTLNDWERTCLSAIDICQRFGIICRPIIMLTTPYTTLDHLEYLTTRLRSWTPENLIEVLFSFYTPHPGLHIKIAREELLNNDLKNFDHLHLVYNPPKIQREKMLILIDLYEELVNTTGSEEFNPRVEFAPEEKSEYNIFFEELLYHQ